MAANLTKTKRRINSVNSTKKITKAMELVAQVKLKRYKDIMMASDSYVNEIVSLISDLFSSRSEKDEKSIYELENTSEKDLVIVINSNLGLCASYNSDIFKYVLANIDPKDVVILPIGLKGYEFFKKTGYIVDDTFFDLNVKIEYAHVMKLAHYIDSLFVSGKYRHIKLIYTKYVNSIRFVPETMQIYPIEKMKGSEEGFIYSPIYDPDVKTLIDELIPIYINSLIYQKIIESQVSEQASRRQAMENANDNADELINTLTLEYNKARQNNITQEITEVVVASLGGK